MNDKNSTPKLPENPFKKKPSGELKKALAPCPRCKSNETTVQNGIFVCHNCGFEGG